MTEKDARRLATLYLCDRLEALRGDSVPGSKIAAGLYAAWSGLRAAMRGRGSKSEREDAMDLAHRIVYATPSTRQRLAEDAAKVLT